MSNLTQRLTQLRKQSGEKVTNPAAWGQEADLLQRVRLARAKATQQSQPILDEQALARQLNGEVITPGLIHIETWLPINELHGCYNAELEHSIRQIANVNELQDLLFVDTETTGLSSAAGTLVFLLGAAEVDGTQLRLEQMLLTQVSAEQAMLDWFNRKCQTKTHLVSYNGKSFDVPLLATRFRMARLASDLLEKSHIDLLHWIRRCHKQHMPDCRLPSAEQHCLGFTRSDDLPGSEAPFVWQEMLRFGQTHRVQPLVQHHAWDIISLLGLLHYVETALMCENPSELDYARLAKHLLQNQQTRQAKELLENNLNTLDNDALFTLSQIYRREQQWQAAVELWHGLHDQGYLPATECLAKYYEHNEKDINHALAYTEILVNREGDIDHLHRKQRLQRKACDS